MTQAQKLEALMQKAKQNGWSQWDAWEVEEDAKGYLKCVQLPYNAAVEYVFDLERIIFNKDFARALFGGTIQYCGCPDCEGGDTPAWQYHLQQAVISDNPIDHYYEQVFGKV